MRPHAHNLIHYYLQYTSMVHLYNFLCGLLRISSVSTFSKVFSSRRAFSFSSSIQYAINSRLVSAVPSLTTDLMELRLSSHLEIETSLGAISCSNTSGVFRTRLSSPCDTFNGPEFFAKLGIPKHINLDLNLSDYMGTRECFTL